MWKAILAAAVIFMAGALTGGLLVRYSNRSPLPLLQKSGENIRATSVSSTNSGRDFRLPPPLMGPLRKDFVERLQRELHISVAQKERIEKIISEGQEQTKVIWEEVAPDMRQAILDTKDKIRAELTEEQRIQFESFFKPRPHAPPKNTAPTNAAPAAVEPRAVDAQ